MREEQVIWREEEYLDNQVIPGSARLGDQCGTYSSVLSLDYTLVELQSCIQRLDGYRTNLRSMETFHQLIRCF